MPATVKATLKREAKQDNTHAVRIRVTADRVARYFTTGVSISKSHWNKKATFEKENWILKSHPYHDEFNRAIRNVVADLLHITLTRPELDAEGIIIAYKAFLKGGSKADFMEYFRNEIIRAESAYKPNTVLKYHNAYNKLKLFVGRETLPFSDLTVSLLRNYITWMQKKLGNGPSTIQKELSLIAAVANNAIREGLLEYGSSPFLHIKIKRHSGKKRKLTKEQLDKLESMDLSGRSYRLTDSRNVFLMQFYLHGARVGDMVALEWDNIKEDRIVFSMQKNGKMKSIKRTPPVDAILQQYAHLKKRSPYVFPFLKKEDKKLKPAELNLQIKRKVSVINQNLNKLKGELGLDFSFTSHVARHTFSNIALQKIGDVNTLKSLLNHSSLRTTEIYLAELSQDDIDDAADKIYG